MNPESSKINSEEYTIAGDGFVARPGTPLSSRAEGAEGIEFRPDNTETVTTEESAESFHENNEEQTNTETVSEVPPKTSKTTLSEKVANKISSGITEVQKKVDSVKNKVQNISDQGKKIAANYRDTKDYLKSLKINIGTIRNDKDFLAFLEKSEFTNIDWEKGDQDSKIRETYVHFERYRDTVKTYTELFDKKIIQIDAKLGSTKEKIEESLFKMSKENPDELRKLEKQIRIAQESEIAIIAQQSKIDVYRSKGGKEGLETKIDTLQKAKSWQSLVLRSLGKDTLFGWGEEYSNAYKRAGKNYGVSRKEDIQKAIENSKDEINTIDKAEKAKSKIQKKYAEQRQAVFNKNDIAKLIHAEIQKNIGKKLNDINRYNRVPKNFEEFKSTQKMIVEAQNQFTEGVNSADMGTMSASELKKYQFDMEAQLDGVLEKFLKSEIERTSQDNLSDQILKHIKQAEFAGISKTDAMRRVYNTFVKIKEKMEEKKDSKATELSRVLANSRVEFV